MNKLTVLITIFILIIITIITDTAVCFGSDANLNNSLNGAVWTDVNANGIQELDESNMAGAIVFVKNMENGNLITSQTDQLGYFKINTLSYGEYTIWSEKTEGFTTAVQTIEINEINTTAILNVVFEQSESQTRTTADFNIFLPIVNT